MLEGYNPNHRIYKELLNDDFNIFFNQTIRLCRLTLETEDVKYRDFNKVDSLISDVYCLVDFILETYANGKMYGYEELMKPNLCVLKAFSFRLNKLKQELQIKNLESSLKLIEDGLSNNNREF